jgi:hypothetical protein
MHAAHVNVKVLNKQVPPLRQPVPFEATEKLGRYLSGNASYLIQLLSRSKGTYDGAQF